MKNKLFILFAAVVCFSSCQEIPPVVGGSDDDIVIIDDQQKNVLIEEYTGVQCVNCPEGAAIVSGLKAQHGKRVIPIAVHAGIFANAFNQSTQELQSNETNAFMSFVGAPSFYPAAAIDRKQFESQTNIIMGKDDWPASVAQQLTEELMVEVQISASYNSSTKTADVSVDLVPLASLDYDDLILSVVLLEDGIVEAQITPSGVDENYVQEHVLRDFFTPTTGESIDPLQLGNSVSKEYSLTIADNIVADNCQVVAFLSRSGANKEVFQVNAKYLVE